MLIRKIQYFAFKFQMMNVCMLLSFFFKPLVNVIKCHIGEGDPICHVTFFNILVFGDGLAMQCQYPI